MLAHFYEFHYYYIMYMLQQTRTLSLCFRGLSVESVEVEGLVHSVTALWGGRTNPYSTCERV